jgi:hypothetical protein
LLHSNILSRLGGPLKLRYGGKTRTFTTQAGGRIDFTPNQ